VYQLPLCVPALRKCARLLEIRWYQKPHSRLKNACCRTKSSRMCYLPLACCKLLSFLWRFCCFLERIVGDSSTPFSSQKYKIFGAQKTPDPRAFGFVVSNERKDSWDENASSLRHAEVFLGGLRLPPEVVSARLNFSALGPINLLLHGKN